MWPKGNKIDYRTAPDFMCSPIMYIDAMMVWQNATYGIIQNIYKTTFTPVEKAVVYTVYIRNQALGLQML